MDKVWNYAPPLPPTLLGDLNWCNEAIESRKTLLKIIANFITIYVKI